jgi:hypothetical protein
MHIINNQNNASSTVYFTTTIKTLTPYENRETKNTKRKRTHNEENGQNLLIPEKKMDILQNCLRHLTSELLLPLNVIYDTYCKITIKT